MTDFPLHMLGVVSTTTSPLPRFFVVESQCDATANCMSRTLLTSSAGLEHAKQLVIAYKTGKIRDMTPELWKAKKIIDSTLHPGVNTQAVEVAEQHADDASDTGLPVFLPFRMSSFVLSNLVVTAGMLTPGLGVRDMEAMKRIEGVAKTLTDCGHLRMASYEPVA